MSGGDSRATGQILVSLLTPSEIKILTILAQAKGEVSRKILAHHLNKEVGSIDQHIVSLRKKLPGASIKTIWGKGFMLGDLEECPNCFGVGWSKKKHE